MGRQTGDRSNCSMPPSLLESQAARHLPLVTLDDASRYMFKLPAGIAARKAWQRPATLPAEAREKPTFAAPADVTAQLHLALFTASGWIFGRHGATRRAKGTFWGVLTELFGGSRVN
jgi:hypothetical protein